MDFRSSWSTTLLVICAVTVTGLVVRREMFEGPSVLVASPALSEVEDWDLLSQGPLRIGAPDARVKMVVFGDFECPACRAFMIGTLPKLRADYGGQLAVVFRHWPLEYHRFAYPAARAADCAARQGKFWEFHDKVYEDQDSLGLKQFSEFAAEAGVPDPTAFLQCNSSTDPVAEIDRDAALALAVGGEGTPTVIVNGKLITRGASEPVVRRLIEEALESQRR